MLNINVIYRLMALPKSIDLLNKDIHIAKKHVTLKDLKTKYVKSR